MPEGELSHLLQRLLDEGVRTPFEVNRLKLEYARAKELARIPRNSDLLNEAPERLRRDASLRLRIKRVRSISGVIVMGIMTAPRGCPHGRCSFCPMEPGFPLSYVPGEPAVMRGYQTGYDPYRQVQVRLQQLRAIGHTPSKVEFVIQGGTFTAMPLQYQVWFIKRCLDALNGADSRSIDEAKKLAEVGPVRNVGISVETKPDWCMESHVDLMLSLGVTRVELGVQALDDAIYKLVKRGHTLDDVVKSFRIAKDSALKICAHMMPGLPGSSPDMDVEFFRRLYYDPEFKPDMVKIYPCLVLKGTELYSWWLEGKYRPYDTEKAVEVVARAMEMTPPWVRIMRVHREVPAPLIVDGVKKGNLREMAEAFLKARGKRCRCIRCREVGHRYLKEGILPNLDDVRLTKLSYEASKGCELFLSYEDVRRDILIGYLRLRIPSGLAHRPEVAGKKAALIRELHVYGPQVPVGDYEEGAWQHKGYGRCLLAEAERIAEEEYDCRKILVISALGTKEYYKGFGYDYDGPYMSKRLGGP